MLNVTMDRQPIRIELVAPSGENRGAYLTVKPWNAPSIAAAQAGARAAYLASPEDAPEAERQQIGYAEFVVALGAWGAVAWEGVGDAGGEALPISHAAVRALLDEHHGAYLALDEKYATPAMAWSVEKNASALSQPGAMPVSGGAKKTATKKARPGAAPSTAEAAATPAQP